MQITWSRTLLITATGMLIVFFVLLFLIFIISLFGKIFSRLSGKISTPKSPIIKEKFPVVHKEISNLDYVPEIIDDEDEVVAAISAAVSFMLNESGVKYKIKSIRNVGVRPAWAVAGIMENTRSF